MADNREKERVNGASAGAAGGEGTWPANNKTDGRSTPTHTLHIKHMPF